MLFQTLEFLVLIIAVCAGLLILRTPPPQHMMLLAASYVFYGWWDVRFLMLIALSSMIDHTVALGIKGVRLRGGERLAISGSMLAGVWLFLGLDWPLVQRAAAGAEFSWADFLVPSWAGAGAAIGAAVGFVVVGHVLYGLVFRLGERGRRRIFLLTSVVANLSMLGFFKYHDFFVENLVGIGAMAGVEWEPSILRVALPVGISFYTFQTMSYTIDVYRGVVEPERSFLRTALYVAYFPQLVAGPILRPNQFLPALNDPWTLHAENVRRGFHLALVGLFKKVLIADSVGPLADTILNAPQGQSSIVIMLGATLFAVQIYCDFSGYTDIARGISRMFGIEIPLNFNFPYASTSIIDFWRRWHISLSSWLRDYLYIPLGGGRVSLPRVYANLMITMLLGGLWHGAAWNFVIWGGYHGALLGLNRMLRAVTARTPALERAFAHPIGVAFRWAVTLYLTLLGWLIFRVGDFDDLMYAMRKFIVPDFRLDIASVGLGRGSPVIAGAALLAFAVLHTISFAPRRWDDQLNRTPGWLLPVIYALLAMIFFLLWPASSEPFIYFQF